jgi:predicted enzyme related to lactoylglutathione lyase
LTTQDGIGKATLAWVTMDCGDPVRLSTFWSAVLGVAEGGRIGDPPQYVMLQGQPSRLVPLQFQRVMDATLPRNRLHLDLVVDDVDRATVRVEQLGGSRMPDGDFEEAGYRWRVMADPEGNEFCLVHQLGPGAAW